MTRQESSPSAALDSVTRLLPDARLTRRAAKGDERAFAAIYQRYHQNIYRFCLSILGNTEDAQDAMQNTMVKAMRALPGEKRQIQLKPWLYRVAHNESIELLRKRREEGEFDPELVGSAGDLTETAATRERLRTLLADLRELPERQRAALVMRELSGLGFTQIGEAFGTSAAVARQTVYEARLSLRQLEAGREMSCEQVMKQLSDADGRVIRRREVQAHLRHCADCRAFRDAIDTRRHDLEALSPLPALAAAGILQGLLGGAGASTAAGSGLAGAAGAGAGKMLATSTIAKTVATVAAVGAIGVTAADRGGLVDAGLPGGSGGSAETREALPANAGRTPQTNQSESRRASDNRVPGNAIRRAVGAKRALGARAGRNGAQLESSKANGPPLLGVPTKGPPGDLPDASRHGQETAAAHKANGGPSSKGRGHSATPPGRRGQQGGGGRAHAKPPKPPKPSKPNSAGSPSAKGKSPPEKSSGSAPSKPQQNTSPTPAPAKPAGTAEKDKAGLPADDSP